MSQGPQFQKWAKQGAGGDWVAAATEFNQWQDQQGGPYFAWKHSLPFAKARRNMANALEAGLVAELHPESLASLKPLAEMNRLGYLTGDSQEGQVDPKFGEQQRAYVHGVMKDSFARKFLDLFNTSTDKVALRVVPTRGGPAGEAYVPVTHTNHKVHTRAWYGSHGGYLIKHMTTFGLVEDQEMFKKGKGKGLTVVEVFDPKWGRAARGRDGLFGDILRILRSLQPKRVSTSAKPAPASKKRKVT